MQRSLILAAILVWAFVRSVTAQDSAKCSPQYQDVNMVDYGPLVLRFISGKALDPSSVPVPGVCVGVFTETEHRLVGTAVTDAKGEYQLEQIRPGAYRLVATALGFGVLNAKVKVVRWPRGHAEKTLILHMEMRGIDSTSYADYK